MNKEQTIIALAREHFDLDTLETRNSDRLDFKEQAVWNCKAALEAAYEAGRKAASQTPPAFMTAKPKAAPQVLRIGTGLTGTIIVTRHGNGRITVTAQGLSAKVAVFAPNPLELGEAARNATTAQELAEAWEKHTGMAATPK